MMIWACYGLFQNPLQPVNFRDDMWGSDGWLRMLLRPDDVSIGTDCWTASTTHLEKRVIAAAEENQQYVMICHGDD